jgi:protoporphyrin/coproporphyrin ferrochelatase
LSEGRSVSIYGATKEHSIRFDDQARAYDALLVLSFGGPEGPDDVMPFLENVTRGRNVPRERLEEVAEHYLHFGGVSPINAQNRALITAIEGELERRGQHLPVYFGNRNWHPFLTDTMRQMRDDGIERALVFATSAFSSYSGCRQYREDVIRAIEEIGDGAPEFDKIRVFYNHPGYILPMAELARATMDSIPDDRRATTRLVYTAHSIPVSMARQCAYELQLEDAANLISAEISTRDHILAYQSRSGPPQVPWLEPDILDVLESLAEKGATDVVVVPVGFISDHMEVLFDLDTEANEEAERLGMTLLRVPTVGTHPDFVRMICDLIGERMSDAPVRPALGMRGPNHDICPVNCCLLGTSGRPRPAA